MSYTLRPYQVQARDEILQAFRNGCTDVYLDAPTGSGKTIIGYAVAQALSGRALYIPADKLLQAQFHDSFPDVPMLQGHANYCHHLTDLHTQKDLGLECPEGCRPRPQVDDDDDDDDDGTSETSGWSPASLVTHRVRRHDESPYDDELRALCEHSCRRLIANAAPLANLNPWKYLYELPRWFTERNLVIIDEADSLDSAVDSYFDKTLSLNLLKSYDWFTPHKDATTADILNALRVCYTKAGIQLVAALEELKNTPADQTRRAKDLAATAHRLRADRRTIAKFGTAAAALAAHNNAVFFWEHTDTPDTLVLRHVSPGAALRTHAWSESSHRLHMTGSFGNNPLAWAQHMGLPTTPDKARVIRVPHQFPVEHRLVTITPVAEMNARAWSDPDIVKRMAYEIDRLHTLHDRPRTLVHVSSRAQANALAAHLPAAITYTHRGENREKAVAQFARRPHAILIAHSCHRGVDLKDDLCRLNIIAKVPYLNMDRSTKARQEADPTYYSWATAAKLVQALGRGVRSPDDYCASYILDGSFSVDSWSGRQVIRQLPKWIGEALRP